MELQISFKHIDRSEALQTYTREKCEKLKKYFEGRISMTWNFSIEKTSKVAHCHMVGNNMDYFGEGRTEDFHASIDDALDKIERQLRKHKEIVKDHLHRNGHRTPAELPADRTEDEEF